MPHRWSSRGISWARSWLVLVAFLAIPGCAPILGIHDTTAVPEDWAIFCQIEDYHVPRRCATADDLMAGIPVAQAAVALTTRQTSHIGLDYSPEANQVFGCAPGQPVAITYVGEFPKGSAACVNGPTWADHAWDDFAEVCRSRCLDWFGTVGNAISVTEFCGNDTHVRASTNYPPGEDPATEEFAYFGACTNGGMEDPAFDTETNPDPRRIPQPARWEFLSAGVQRSGPEHNTLTRTAAETGQWDQGAATLPVIGEGDGYLEFTATDTLAMDRACGLSSGLSPDTDPDIDTIGFGVRLWTEGRLRIWESGPVPPFIVPYHTGDRVRIAFADNFDGTASIAYYLIPAACQGPNCYGALLRSAGPAAYPLQVDASLLTHGASLADVRLVWVKTSPF